MRVSRTLAAVAGTVLLPLVAVVGTASPSHAAARSHPAVLQIMVTNDDGYNSPGIAAISSALAKLPNVHVTVVAPATDESGTGGSTTKGHLKFKTRKTLNGLRAYAVQGFPADTVRVALKHLHLHPDLVVSGINAGQNLGPAVELSGTVGAARAAVAHGIPAIAVSSGIAGTIRYGAAVPIVVHWVTHHRAALLRHRSALHVLNLNVPSCAKGRVRGVVRIKADLNEGDLGQALGPSNCRSTAPPGKNDVQAFTRGFATESVVPAKAASPATSAR